MEDLDQEYQEWLADPEAQAEYLLWALTQEQTLQKENHELYS
jgi:3-phenylpropionate/cinnamic acid dioxygenase small subunit